MSSPTQWTWMWANSRRLWRAWKPGLLLLMGEQGSVPGSGRSPAGRHVHLFQYSCLENPIDRGAWWAIFHEISRVRPDLATKAPLSEKINIVIRIFIKNNTIGGSVGLLEYIPKYTLEKKDFACLTLEGKWFIQAITWCIWWSKSVWVKSWYCKRFLMHQS